MHDSYNINGNDCSTKDLRLKEIILGNEGEEEIFHNNKEHIAYYRSNSMHFRFHLNQCFETVAPFGPHLRSTHFQIAIGNDCRMT